MAKRLARGLGPRAAERRRLAKKKQDRETLARLERQQKTAEPRALDPKMLPLRDYMLAKPGCTEDFPFGPQAMVFRVGGKICGLLAWEEVPVYISLKCDPEYSQELREQFSGITGAYHMNKVHWHSVAMDGSVSIRLVCELMDQSYALVVASLPQREQERLRGL